MSEELEHKNSLEEISNQLFKKNFNIENYLSNTLNRNEQAKTYEWAKNETYNAHILAYVTICLENNALVSSKTYAV